MSKNDQVSCSGFRLLVIEEARGCTRLGVLRPRLGRTTVVPGPVRKTDKIKLIPVGSLIADLPLVCPLSNVKRWICALP